MKCTNKVVRTLCLLLFVAILTCGCASNEYRSPYSRQAASSAFMMNSYAARQGVLDSFASNLCVTNAADINNDVPLVGSYAAGLFDLNQCEIMYAANIHEKMPPASLTKVMTALVALKYGALDDKITVTSNCKITESGAQVWGFKEGDVITLDQALNVLLLYSANDAALIIAEHVGGSVDGFIQMMNQEAKAIGATESNFVNPHGLTADNHYTTIYDLYLIFNEVIKYERFSEIIQLNSYSTVYYDKNGQSVNMSFDTTNQYLKGNVQAPDSMTILGGKTGTTNAAGNCLIIYSKDASGNPYISVILRADTRDNLYIDMNSLLQSASQ